MKAVVTAGALFAIAVVAIAATVRVAERHAGAPLRCAEGSVAIGPRCCGEGQTLSGARCVGQPTRCPTTHEVRADGCVATRRRVELPGGTLTLGPSDWEAEGVVQAREIRVGALRVDAFEVDVATLDRCIDGGACRGARGSGDPGRAAVLTLDDAKAVCAFTGARVPTDDEWTFLAMGVGARRYPWGDTGLICSRASFGLVSGPCARGASGPDTVGTRPLGRTPDGLHDVAGNVAEWAIAGDGTGRARGGSFASTLPSDLRGWRSSTPTDLAAIGVRCVE